MTTSNQTHKSSNTTLEARNKAREIAAPDLNDIQSETNNCILKLRPEVPDNLFHYTRSNSIISIIESDVLWATDLRFLNDKTEITYGSELLKECLEDLKGEFSSSCCDSLLKHVENFYKWGVAVPCFTVCFSEAFDDLQQWMAYANGTSGFAIGFDLRSLNLKATIGRDWSPAIDRENEGNYSIGLAFKDLYKEPADQVALIRILYDKDTQSSLLRSFMSKIMSSFQANMRTVPETEQDLLDALENLYFSECLKTLTEFYSIFKSEHWKHEKEWRLLCRPNMGENVRFYRDGPMGITPYVKLGLKGPVKFIHNEKSDSIERHSISDHEERLPIKSIVYGQSTNVSVLSEFLQSNLYSNLTFTKSTIPLR